jgi:hypothetical protein
MGEALDYGYLSTPTGLLNIAEIVSLTKTKTKQDSLD